MKYVLTCIAIIFFTFLLNAQKAPNFGLKGGLNLTFFIYDEEQFGISRDVVAGYYDGVFVDFNIDEKFHIQPEILYIGLGDFDFLNAPIYLKYDINNAWHILVGPSLNYFFDFFSNKFKVRADLGLAYDILPRLDIHMKYTLGFEEITPNGLFIGGSYTL